MARKPVDHRTPRRIADGQVNPWPNRLPPGRTFAPQFTLPSRNPQVSAPFASDHRANRRSWVKIITLAEGEISALHVGLNGTMNALFLQVLGVHRALETHMQRGDLALGEGDDLDPTSTVCPM